MGSQYPYYIYALVAFLLCFLLMVITWQYVLALFVLAGFTLAYTSWLADSNVDQKLSR